MITTAWRAFWVALGASVVIVGQGLFFPAPAPSVTPGAPVIAVPAPHGPSIADRRAGEHPRRIVARRHAP